jgi:hypothetical protein
MSFMRISVKEVLRFFDTDRELNRYASGVKAVFGDEFGLQLLCHYLRHQGEQAEIVSRRTTTGGRVGHRLDGWLQVGKAPRAVLYQVEVKMWSATSLGGKTLPLDADRRQIRAYKRRAWRSYWTGTTFRSKQLKKVLRPMKPPSPARSVRALACLWAPMHPKGGDAALFRVRLRRRRFSEVWVFSMSSYLRQLRRSEIDLHLPDVEERLRLLRRMVRARRAA